MAVSLRPFAALCVIAIVRSAKSREGRLSLLLFLSPIAVGWLVAVGVETKQGWRAVDPLARLAGRTRLPAV